MHHLYKGVMGDHPKRAEYEAAAGEIREMVKMANEGKHKEAYLHILCKALDMLRQKALTLPGTQRDVEIIDGLLHKFQGEMHGPAESTLEGLLGDPRPHNPK